MKSQLEEIVLVVIEQGKCLTAVTYGYSPVHHETQKCHNDAQERQEDPVFSQPRERVSP